jgi:hypothetical protein
MDFMGPIPGMSLTKEPGNAPWEQPPLYNTVEESLAFYLEKFNDEETLDELMFTLEVGYPVDAMVDFLTSYSVMEGYHSVDVKMILSPVLHEYIMSLADAAGVKYTEELGLTKEERMAERDKKRSQVLFTKMMEEGGEPSPAMVDQAEDLLEGETSSDENEEEAPSPLIKRRM